MELKDRVAMITGGGSGIGGASARRLSRAGARVALLGRGAEDLEAVADEIVDAGGDALPLVADIADADALRESYAQVLDRWGRLDIVFANAGVNGVWAPIEELDLEDWRETVEINLTGTFQTIKFAVPHMKERGGSVIITSSVNGTRMFSNTGATAYACTKGAQVVMSRMLALELAQYGIRVNAICPGAVETSIEESTEEEDVDRLRHPDTVPDDAIPLGGEAASSEQVADLVLFLAGDASNHITGTEVWIDGGQSLLKG
jgi:NAD(P)-dependent dehydrogenase (short-subunit alcohol dehydrogenase family)